MTKEEEIEKIVDIIEDNTKEIWVGGAEDTEQSSEEVVDADKAAQALYDAGYRKVNGETE